MPENPQLKHINTLIQAIDWESVGITNDDMFKTIMRKKENVGPLINYSLGIGVRNIIYIADERRVSSRLGSKQSGLDIFVEGDDGATYAVEMQAGRFEDLVLRMRYYQGNIDVLHMGRGATYLDMRRSYIIFFCTDDPLGQGLMRYTLQTTVRETGAPVDDRVTKVVFNAKGAAAPNEHPEIVAFMRLMRGDNAPDGSYARGIERQVEGLRRDVEWRRRHVLAELHWEREIARERQEAKAEGLAEGRAEGLAEGKAEGRAEGLAENDRTLRLFGILSRANRVDDIGRASGDGDYRDALFREFGLA